METVMLQCVTEIQDESLKLVLVLVSPVLIFMILGFQ